MAHKDYKWKGQALKQHLNSQKPSDFFHLCFSLCIYSIFFEPAFLCFSSPVPNEHDNLSPWFYPVKECTLQTPDLITYYLGVRAKLLGSNKGNSAWATEGLRAGKSGTKKGVSTFFSVRKKLLKGFTYHGCPGFCFLGMSLVIPSLSWCPYGADMLGWDKRCILYWMVPLQGKAAAWACFLWVKGHHCSSMWLAPVQKG